MSLGLSKIENSYEEIWKLSTDLKPFFAILDWAEGSYGSIG